MELYTHLVGICFYIQKFNEYAVGREVGYTRVSRKIAKSPRTQWHKNFSTFNGQIQKKPELNGNASFYRFSTRKRA